LNKIQELKVIKAGTVSDVRILNFATKPDSPLPAQRSIIVTASLLLGAILGCIVALAKRSFNRNVEDPHWFEEHFEIPTLAIIPYSKKQKEFTHNYMAKKQLGLQVLAQSQPRDVAIEALRSLRTSLQLLLLESKNNIITLIGISPTIGKSFVSVNFAHLLADAGKRTILIDGDLRKGYLFEYFSKIRMPGLSEVLEEKLGLEKVIQKTNQKNLDFIETGKYPLNPSELLMNERFKDILSKLSLQYDLIIIDTAPVLAVTDATIIASYSGVNLLLLGSGMHQPGEIELAVKRLQSNGIRINGTVFNCPKKHIIYNAYDSYKYYEYSYS
jgi:tyrosine-protein kinase Etk/Wzc